MCEWVPEQVGMLDRLRPVARMVHTFVDDVLARHLPLQIATLETRVQAALFALQACVPGSPPVSLDPSVRRQQGPDVDDLLRLVGFVMRFFYEARV